MDIAWPLYGHDYAQQEFLDAFESGKLHHAWLVEGPKGIGKARLALRCGAFLLGARGAEGAVMDALEDDPVVRKCLAEGHPDLRIITRQANDKGKLKQDIAVDQVRELSHFFSLKPAMGGWRVGIIDAVDELNANGANALLKTLEEPPPQSVIFLISHKTRAMLPTIKSRARKLSLGQLSEEDVAKAVAGAENEAAANKLARGRPGLGLELATQSSLVASNAAKALLRALPRPSRAATTAVIQSASVDASAYQAFLHEVYDWLTAQSEDVPGFAETWLAVARLAGEATELNMERAQTVAKVLALLAQRPAEVSA